MHVLLYEYRAACKCKAPSRGIVMLSVLEERSFGVFGNKNRPEKKYTWVKKSNTAELTVPFLTSLFTSKL